MKKKFAKRCLIVFLIIVFILTSLSAVLFFNCFGVSVPDSKVHFSIDDSITVFQDLETNKEVYTSIFDNYELKRFHEYHTKYGLQVSLYCFYENDGFNLSMVSDKYADEFVKNSDWLKFGFHALHGASDIAQVNTSEMFNDYQKTIKELKRIVGEESITYALRLDYFAGDYKNITALKKKGVKELFTADDDRLSYYLDREKADYLMTYDDYTDKSNDIMFISTDLRLDSLKVWSVYPNLLKIYANDNQNKKLVVFTHEWLLDEDMYKKIELFCNFSQYYGYEFVNEF